MLDPIHTKAVAGIWSERKTTEKSTQWATSGLLENRARQRSAKRLRSADVGMALCSL